MDWTRMPPLSTLRSFEAAARHLSFSEAGKEMNVTHAAVAQQVRRLEQWLTLSLIYREGRGLALTEEGRFLSARLSQGFAQLSEALEELEEREAGRPVNISMTPSFATSWLMPRLSRFRERRPDVELMLSPSARLVDMKKDGFDLAIRFGRGDWEGLEVEPLLPARFCVVAAKSLLKGRKVEKPEDLADLPWLHETGLDEIGIWLRNRGLEDVRSIRSKHGITHLPGHMVLQALRDGQGVACTASVFVEEELKQGKLVSLFDTAEEEGTAYFLARLPGPVRSQTQAVIDWLRDEAAQGPGSAEAERPAGGPAA
ncbi:LysR substrate-binding domain-containing protein [Limibacillus halophilus]